MAMTDETKKEIVKKLSKVMEKFSPPMVIISKSDNGLEMIGNKKVLYGSTKKLVPGMFFCSIKPGKNMVSLHFFPMYFNEKTYMPLAPNMFRCLKGKTCFNITKVEQIDEKELEAMLKKGVESWVKSGYMQ